MPSIGFGLISFKAEASISTLLIDALASSISCGSPPTRRREHNSFCIFLVSIVYAIFKLPTSTISSSNCLFNSLFQAALNIEDGLDGLRYDKVIIATDADDDGMHIRLLMLNFFLQFFPDLVKSGHVYILQTPLFRVRNKKEKYYCYTDEERIKAINRLGDTAEITRFKGLGEISPDEFGNFIGKDIRLDPVSIKKEDSVANLLSFYMGKNTPERQEFIISNLRIENDSEEELLGV